jgi:sugar/nucleoside kinase (ribokinase family)
LESNNRRGVLAGGNWIIDLVKLIDVYPSEEKLANIIYENASNGGAPYNVLKALYKMNFSFPLEGVGAIGDDDKGAEILRQCQEMQINSDQIKMIKGANTSYTDVMTVNSTGLRTFFHYRGANALLDESYFDFATSQAKIFHLGYLLLLDEMDNIRSDGLTGAAKVLENAKKSGFITSADIVSEQSKRYKKIIPISLPFIDILFINEFEAKMLTGIEIVDDEGRLSKVNGYKAAEEILNMGVLNWVLIHFPTGVIAINKNGNIIFQQSINVPNEKIKGTVGAGDAFAAGVLAGIHENWSMERCLGLGVNVAAISLLDATSSGGILSWQECMKLEERFGYRDIVESSNFY